MLACIQERKIKLEEIYHFENGMKKCKELNKIPVSMSIDTWVVDYVLLDEDDHVLGDSYGYRDYRTDGMDEVVNWNPFKQTIERTNKDPKYCFLQIMGIQKKC